MTNVIILNSKAGSVNKQVIEHLRQHFGHYDLRFSERKGHCAELAAEALDAGAKRVLIGGGDGTVGEVINGIGDRIAEVEIGILPCGTGNDFVRSLNMPIELANTIVCLKQSCTRSIDVIRVAWNDTHHRYFLNVIVGGFERGAKEQIEADFKDNWGPFGYLAAVKDALDTFQVFSITLQMDDLPPVTRIASTIIVSNGKYMAGGVAISPQAEIDDGLMNISVISATTSADIALLAAAVGLGTHLESPHFETFKCRKVVLKSDPPIPFHMDDVFATSSRFEIEVQPKCVRVLGRQAAGL